MNLYARYEHGNWPITITHQSKKQRIYQVSYDTGTKTYSTLSSMLNDFNAPQTSFRRYFKLDTPQEPSLQPILEKRHRITVYTTTPKLGIDLKNRSHEVRKLLFAGFAGKILSQGYDPEDVLQEVFTGLLVRNKGKCPWDPRKSTFGHYVHMAINGILINYHRKQQRRADRHHLTLDTVPSRGSCTITYGSDFDKQYEALQKSLPTHKPEQKVANEILPLVVQGYKRNEIVKMTGYTQSTISRALASLRASSRHWATTK